LPTVSGEESVSAPAVEKLDVPVAPKDAVPKTASVLVAVAAPKVAAGDENADLTNREVVVAFVRVALPFAVRAPASVSEPSVPNEEVAVAPK